jgi:transcriptional regulator with XRE-family HTH domain
MTDPISKIVNQLVMIRNEKGLSKRRVSRETGFRMQRLAHWEKGNIVPAPESLSKWANALGYELVMVLKDAKK